MKVLLSIKPQFVAEILKGNKIFEFRRVLHKRQELKRIVVYASSPVCQVVGEIEIEDIISQPPQKLWELTKAKAGITESFFNEYFQDKELAHAIKIGAFYPYDKPSKLSDLYPGVKPPQSFCYVEK